jgi:hypothetical protein
MSNRRYFGFVVGFRLTVLRVVVVVVVFFFFAVRFTAAFFLPDAVLDADDVDECFAGARCRVVLAGAASAIDVAANAAISIAARKRMDLRTIKSLRRVR